MAAPFVIIRRYPYEEPYHTQLQISASNGSFSGTTDIYCNVDDIGRIGTALRSFPARTPDEFVYEYGSEDPTDRFYRLFRLRAYTINATGHAALQFVMNLNDPEPREGICRFSIPVEPAALNRLGSLLMRFGDLRHLELRWGPGLDRAGLFEDYQAEPAAPSQSSEP